jgi:NitT/TauT family transport system ATP-binding protein
MMAPPLVQLDDVRKTFASGVTAVDSVSLTLAEGEFVSLLGPSGCGKSTILRMIAGLSAPTSGTVRRVGNDNGDIPGAAVGCVFQDPTLLPWATVRDNAYLPLRIAGLGRIAARPRIDEALRLVGLAEFATAYPRQLSGGMRMRASIARALVTDPRVLLLDEPLAALDEISRQQLNDELLALWRVRRWTTLFITHSVLEAVYLSTRIVVMSSRPGRIVADIDVDLPAERTSAIRVTARYLELCRQVSHELEAAMANARNGPLKPSSVAEAPL